MREQRSERAKAKTRHRTVVVASGYGVRIYVERSHLVVHDGLGRDRRTQRFNRATSGLERLVVIGHEGYVTLEALRWIRDVGAAFVQIDRDANVVCVTARERLHESTLRRAQVLAAQNETGRVALVQLLRAKLNRQAEIAERLRHVKATVVRNHKHEVVIADAIREQCALLDPGHPVSELRKIESIAGRYYWQTWAHVPIRFDRSWRGGVPDHWHKAGPRTSRADRKWPRRASSPAHALLNYTYAILETEATIAAYALGFDPSLGLMHADQRYRTSLATDLMEPARPSADELVLGMLEETQLRRGDVVETRNGVCRLGSGLAQQLAGHSSSLRLTVAPHAEQLARTLLGRRTHPTPLTRSRHRESMKREGKLKEAGSVG